MMDKKTCKHEQYCIDCNRVISELVESSKAEGRREVKEELLGKIPPDRNHTNDNDPDTYVVCDNESCSAYLAYNNGKKEITDLINNTL